MELARSGLPWAQAVIAEATEHPCGVPGHWHPAGVSPRLLPDHCGSFTITGSGLVNDTPSSATVTLYE